MKAAAKGRHGFASMDPARVREIASQGGKAAHALKLAHRWTSEEARAAGRKGGLGSARRRLERRLADVDARLERERAARTQGP